MLLFVVGKKYAPMKENIERKIWPPGRHFKSEGGLCLLEVGENVKCVALVQHFIANVLSCAMSDSFGIVQLVK